MKLQDFRVGFRILVQDPVYSLVAILGLGLGLAVSLLLFGFARYSWQYNSHVPAADNVYIIKHRNNLHMGGPWYDQSPLLLREAAKAAPGVTAASGYVNWFPFTAHVNAQLFKLNSLTVLPGFADMMGLHAVKGDVNEALTRPDSFAITEAGALRLFGTTDVLGKVVNLTTVEDQGGPVRIAAVLSNPPANTTIPYETLNGLNLSIVPPGMRNEALSGEHGWHGNLLVRVHPGISLSDLTERLQGAVDRAPGVLKVPPDAKQRLGNRKLMDIGLSPLREAYFDQEVTPNNFSQKVDRGDRKVVVGLMVIAVLILALAAINYVNLATIRVIRRQREVGMRKVLGARAGRIALQFVAESLLVSLLSTVIGLALAMLALPVFGELMGRDLSGMVSLEHIGAALAIGAVLGLLTAIYPAWVAFGVRPSQVLAGRPDAESQRSKRLRQGLAVLQMAAAMGLASFTMAISWQTRFAMDASPGFDASSLLVFDLPEAETVQISPKARNLITALSAQPGIAGVAVSADPVGRSNNQWSTEIRREGGTGVMMDVKSVSANFFGQYGIRPVAGRLFDPGIDKEDDAVPTVINEVAARKLGFASAQAAIGQTVLFRDLQEGVYSTKPKRVVGVAPEIRFNSLRQAPAATLYELSTIGATLTVRARGSLADADAAVRSVWPKYYPNAVLRIQAAQDVYASNYADDARLAKLLVFSTAVAMLMAAFGAYVLAADTVQRRVREIALRKLYGAKRRQIGILVAKEAGATILMSAVIGLPVAALAIARYLASYIEHAPIGGWTLAFALAASLLTAAFAVARHAWIAMTLKPAMALRA